jgi:hypothetical protein
VLFPKEMKDIYNENYKMLKKEIEEDGNITYVHLSAELIL